MVSLAACQWATDTDTKPLAGPYFLATDYEGFSFVQYGNPWFKKPRVLVGLLDSTGPVGHYLGVHRSEDSAAYFLLLLTATNEEQAQTGLLGPLTETAYRRKLYQLRGDSMLRLSSTPY
jgi:hypothetical protein